MAYLDNDGLLYFWQQIKTKFAAASHKHAIADTTGLQAALDYKATFFTRSNMDDALAQVGIATPLDYANAKTLMANAGMFYQDGEFCANVLAMAEVISALCAQIDANATTIANSIAGPVPIANGGTGATAKDGARKNLGIATVADVAWTDLWKDTSGNYVRWACRNNVVYVKWKIPQATADQWKAGILPAGYRPSSTVTVAAWTEGNRMATGWVDVYGDVFLRVNSAQTNGTNQGSLSYPIF